MRAKTVNRPASGAVGDEAFRARQQVVVPRSASNGLQCARVGARLRLRERERGYQLTACHPRQVGKLLRLRSGGDQAEGPDAVVGADERPVRGRGLSQLEGNQHLLFHGEAQPPVFLRDGQPEQAHLAHVGHHVVRNAVLVRDLLFQGNEATAHEALHGEAEFFQRLRVPDHVPPPATPRKSARRFSRKAALPSRDSGVP